MQQACTAAALQPDRPSMQLPVCSPSCLPCACPQVSSNFAGHPLLAPRLLMSAARWNLCLLDAARRQRGDPDLCWCAGLRCNGRDAALFGPFGRRAF